MAGSEKENWNTAQMREQRTNWNLGADTQLLQYMQNFSQKLLTETHSTLNAVDQLDSDIVTFRVEVGNLGSKFWALSDTQFVENRVYDDDDEVLSPTEPAPKQEETKKENENAVLDRLKESLQNGFQVLDTKFEMIKVLDSDSEDEDDSPTSDVVMKPLNRYKERRLPYLIGSAEFQADNSLGLQDPPSDEESDDYMSASDKADNISSESEDEPSNAMPSTYETNKTTKPSFPKSIQIPETHITGNTDYDENKLFGGDTSMNRPASVNSSVASGQSSNASESVMKTRDDFKNIDSNYIPMPLDDTDDLFASKSVDSQHPSNKKPIPAGGIKIFQGDISPFFGGHQHKQEVGNEESEQPQKSKLQDENGFISRLSESISKQHFTNSSVSSTTSSTSKNKNQDLFDDQEYENDIFSHPIDNRHSSKNNHLPPKPKSNSLKNDIVSTTRSILFDDPGFPEEDDLFSTKGTFSNPKAKDIFTDTDNENIFSNHNTAKDSNLVKSVLINKGTEKGLYSNKTQSGKNIETSKSREQLNSSNNKKSTFFDDDDDLFGASGSYNNDDLFKTSSSATLPVSNQVPSKVKTNPLPASKHLQKYDLWGNDDDDLFNDKTLSSKNDDTLFNSSCNDLDRGAAVNKLKLPNSKPKESLVKGKHNVLNFRKGLEKKSLFESDSDDDLFSSPQGSLSSRKSIANTMIEPKNDEKSNNDKKDNAINKRVKTDFSSIFSDDSNEQNIMPTSSIMISRDDQHDLFEDNNSKIPDLFKSSSSIVSQHKSAKNELINTKTEKELKPDPLLSTAENIIHKQNPIPKVNYSSPDDLFRPSKEVQGLKATTDNDRSKQEKPPNTQIYDSSPDDLFRPSKEVQGLKATTDNDKPKHHSSTYRDDSSPDDLFGVSDILNVGKLEPPKTLNVTSVTDNTSDSEKQAINTVRNKNVENDSESMDGEISALPIKLPHSKIGSGKLKPSRLININTAALLPGAKPQFKSERKTFDQSETQEKEDDIIPSDKQRRLGINNPSTQPSKTDPSLQSHGQSSDMCNTDLLQSVVKERVKIQVKRRPSSRHARQAAIRASTIEVESESSSPSPSTTVLSPSTDEDDLFSVPPLSGMTFVDDNVSSPKTEIFGTPTVLSPYTNENSPSFNARPYISSQPPPLEDDEDDCTQDDDLFGYHENLFVSSNRENDKKKPKVEAINKHASKNTLLSSESLFSNIREAPPPLIFDEDEEDIFQNLSDEGDLRMKNDNSNKAEPSSKSNTLPFISDEKTTFNKSKDGPEFEERTNTLGTSNILRAISDTKQYDSTSKKTEDLFTDEELFSCNDSGTPDLFSQSGSKSAGSNFVSTSSNSNKHSDKSDVETTNRLIMKKNTLFDDSENDSNLFSSTTLKNDKIKPALKSSLFGDHDDNDDDDGIFGSSSSTRKNSSSSLSHYQPSVTAQKISGSTQKARSRGSLKPVKLEAKEAFTDPLLSNND